VTAAAAAGGGFTGTPKHTKAPGGVPGPRPLRGALACLPPCEMPRGLRLRVVCRMFCPCSSRHGEVEVAGGRTYLNFAHLRINKSDRGNFLGEGGFGEVWRGRYVATTVAVKMYKVASGSEETKAVCVDLRERACVQACPRCMACMGVSPRAPPPGAPP
jgi:hypothetical protein